MYSKKYQFIHGYNVEDIHPVTCTLNLHTNVFTQTFSKYRLIKKLIAMIDNNIENNKQQIVTVRDR